MEERRVGRRLGRTAPLRVLDEGDYDDDIRFLHPEEELPSEQEANAFVDNMDIYDRATYDANPRGTSLYFQARSLLPPEITSYMGTQMINERLRNLQPMPISFQSKIFIYGRHLITIRFNHFHGAIRDGVFTAFSQYYYGPYGQGYFGPYPPGSIVSQIYGMTARGFNPTGLRIRDPQYLTGIATYNGLDHNGPPPIFRSDSNASYEQKSEFHTNFLANFVREFKDFIETNTRCNLQVVVPSRIILPPQPVGGFIPGDARHAGAIAELSPGAAV